MPSILSRRVAPLPGAALVAALVALAALLSAGLAYHHSRQEARQARVAVWRVATGWDRLRADAERQLEWLARHAMADPVLQEAMRRGDAEALLARAGPQLGQWNAHFGVTHWTFVATDRRALLRVHSPGDRGAPVTRKTLLDAAQSNRPATGLELGPTATPTLRHALPWHARGELLGYIELGMEVGVLNRRLKDLLNVEVFAAVHKAHTEEAAFDEGRKVLGFPGTWHQHESIAVTAQTLASPPPALFDAWQRFVAGTGETSIEIRDGDRTVPVGFVALRDTLDRPVASLAILGNGASGIPAPGGTPGIVAIAAFLAGALLTLAALAAAAAAGRLRRPPAPSPSPASPGSPSSATRPR